MINTKLLARFHALLTNLPIKRKLLLSFLILIVVPITLIGFFSYYRSRELLKIKTEQYTKDILLETGKNIEVKLQEAERLTFQVISNTEIQKVLNNVDNGFITEDERLAHEKTMDAQLQEILTSDADIKAAQVISNSGLVYDVKPPFINFRATKNDRKTIEKWNGSAYWFDTDPTTQTIAVGRVINNFINQRKIGYEFIYLKESSLYYVYKNTELFKNGEFFILNSSNEIISHKDKGMLNKKMGLSVLEQNAQNLKDNFISTKVNGKNSYVTYHMISGTSWKLVCIIPAVEYEQDIIWMRNWTLLLCIPCCLLALIISFIISDSISKPIRKLTSKMTKVGKGDFNVTSKHETKDEMGVLDNHFNNMVAQVQQLIQEVYQEQLLQQKAELKSLRMQINPHFLYNTLESINWMARIKGAPEIGVMVKALGDLMRSSISGDDFVLIEDEIKNVNNYLTIQKFRYGDKFDVNIDISEDILKIKVPKLIIQPIVENSIVHGIENMDGNGIIQITGTREDTTAVILVKDNGIGITKNLISSLLSEKNNNDLTEDHTKIGLHNVDRRIKLYYGQEYGLNIESSPELGTIVRIVFPFF